MIKVRRTLILKYFSNFYKNLIALGTGLTTQLIIQVLSLPIFLSQLNIQTYSIWVLSYNIAQISGLLDFGTVAYSQNKIAYLHANNKQKEIDWHLKQVINIIVLNNLFFIILIYLFKTIINDNIDTSLIVFLIFSNLLQSLWGLLEALTRIDSNVATGLHSSNALRICEFSGIILGILLFTNKLSEIALVGFTFKAFSFLFMRHRFLPRYRFMRFGLLNLSQIVEIGKKGFPFFITKIADIIILSGFLIVLHGKVSENIFVLFVSARTFFRLGLQITSLAAHSYSYEMSESWIAKDFEKMRTLIRKSFRITVILSCLGVAVYLFIGHALFESWVNNKLAISNNIILCGALYSFILSLNQNQKTKFNAINHNYRVSTIQIIYSFIMLAAVAFIPFSYSVVDLFVVLSIFELLCYATVGIFLRTSIQKYFDELKFLGFTNGHTRNTGKP